MSAFYSHGTSEEATRRTEDFFEGTRHSLATAFASTDASESDSMKNDFLRSHWISLNGNILKDELFDGYNDELARDPSQHEKFLRQLEKSLRTYRAFNDYKYSHPEAGVISFDFLQTLNSLQAKLSRPALLAVASLFDDPEDLQDAMLRSAFIFEKLHMRWKICNRRTNTIDQPLAELAKKISKGTLGRTPKEVADGITMELKKIKDAPTRIHHALKHPTASNRSLDYKHIPLLTGGGYTLEKGIKLMINQFVESTQQGYGFRDDDQFRELIYSLGNTFLAQNGRINPNLEFNGRHAISRLDAKTIKVRCEELAEVAADIWHF
jgi:hypothetical protein